MVTVACRLLPIACCLLPVVVGYFVKAHFNF